MNNLIYARKERSPPASLPFGGQVTEQTTAYCLVERFLIECGKTKTKQINYQLHYSVNLEPQ